MNRNSEISSKTDESPESKGTPYGRKQVMKAILDATEQLLSAHSPSEISVRQIAKLAGVNHSLIHRHFDTKEKVIMAVHERIVNRMAGSLTGIERLEGNVGLFFRASESNRSRRILLTRAMIDGVNPRLMQHQFPVMRRLADLVKKKKRETENPTKYEAEILTAFFAAMVMGWFLYEPFLLVSTDLENRDKEEIYSQVIEILEECIEKFC